MKARMNRRIVGIEEASKNLGMSMEEFTCAVGAGYFPRVLILRFGNIEKYDLDGLLEYGRTGCTPLDLMSHSGRSLLRRLLILEARLCGIMKSFKLSSFAPSDENPLKEFLLTVNKVSEDLRAQTEEIQALDLYENFNLSNADIFDLEEKVDELTHALLKASEKIKMNSSRLLSAADRIEYFSQDILRIDNIKDLSAQSFFEAINDHADVGDVDEILDWEKEYIAKYLAFVEDLNSTSREE